MEAAFGRLHKSGAGAEGARPTLVESIMVDGFLEHACAFGHMLKTKHLSWLTYHLLLLACALQQTPFTSHLLASLTAYEHPHVNKNKKQIS